MAETIELGIVGIKNMGEYDSQTNYEKLNVVTYQGSSYCALRNTTGNLPTDTDYWQLYAERGSVGPEGPQGPQGPKPVKGTDYYTDEDISELEDTLSRDVTTEVTSQLGSLTSATPLVASSVAGMTDTTRVYVNTTDGHWYWYDGSNWVDGGVYQATGIETDKSLNVLNKSADSKTVGNRLKFINDIINFNKENILENEEFEDVYLKYNGAVSAYNNLVTTERFIPIDSEKKYLFKNVTSIGDAGLCFYDNELEYISGVKSNSINNTIVTIPENAMYFKICITTDSVSDISVTVQDIELWENVNNTITFDETNTFVNDYTEGKVGASGTNSVASITDVFDDYMYVKNISIFLSTPNMNRNDYTHPVYIADYSATGGNSCEIVLKEKVCELIGADDYVNYEFETPLILKPNQILVIYNPQGGWGYRNTRPQEMTGISLYATFNEVIEEGSVLTYSTNKSNFVSSCKVTYIKTKQDSIAKEINSVNFKIDKNKKETDNLIQETKIKHNYKTVFFDNFNVDNEQWINNNNAWNFDYTNREVSTTVVGDITDRLNMSNFLRLDRKYQANKRTMRALIKFSSDSVLQIGLRNKDNTPDGNTTVVFDMVNKKIINNNNSENITINIDFNKFYIIEMDVYKNITTYSIIDYISGEKNQLRLYNDDGYTSGENYIFAMQSGTKITIKEFKVSIQNEPYVYIVGDSITAQVASAPGGWAYRFSEDLDENVVISARGNDSAPSTVEKFETEMKHIRPRILMWCHGHNGEGLKRTRLEEVQSLCDSIGCKMIVNHVTCWSGDSWRSVNELIESMGYDGARFDIATAIDNDISRGIDSTLFFDNLHPNLMGSQKQYERLRIDLPELFLK